MNIAKSRNAGEYNSHARLSYKDVAAIKLMLAKGIKQRIIAQQYSISQSHVSNINRGFRWVELELL